MSTRPLAVPLPMLSAALLAMGGLRAQVPCYESNLGTNLGLTDDSVAVNRPLGFTFPGPGGGNYTAISISSNGFVWLGSNNGNGCCSGVAVDFLAQGPRIAPIWTDLNPSAGGSVDFNTFAGSPARAVVTWDNVPEYGSGGVVSAQLQLFSDGSFTMSWSQGTSITAPGHDTLVGVTQGLGALANTANLSAITGAAVVNTGTNPTLFEVLPAGGFDLGGKSLIFVPDGAGGYGVGEQVICRNATFTAFGRGCPNPPTVYELFAAGAFDLANHSLRFQPNGAGGWNVAASSAPPDLQVAHAVVCTRDDQLAVGLQLPFAWHYAGSSTTSIDVSSNGCVYLQSGTIPDPRCCEGSVARFLAETPSIAALWLDLYPPGGGAVYFDTDAVNQKAWVTWRDCPEYGNSAVLCTAQLVLEQGGAFELRYGTVGNSLHACLVGFTLGGGAPDPGNLDLSAAVPFDTGPGGTPLSLAAMAGSRPAVGTTFTMVVSGVPAGAQLGLLVLGTGQLLPPLDLAPLGMPGCFRHVTLDATTAFGTAAAPLLVALPIPNATGLIGSAVYAQVALHAPGVNALQLVASNGGQLSLGQ